ncbi:MAG: polysaccharide deacetylase family protein [Bifidobacteriaceae bacterium]|jgi:peptidoglycan/xylan/chitin deacetylase (PgdA/CDA1 family)|nr:polysaccharide deacetylase family protein [Bifidobacteriaceae bacterium]
MGSGARRKRYWQASAPVVVAVLCLGLLAFAFMLPRPARSAAPAPLTTTTAPAPLEVSKAPPPPAEPEPPEPPAPVASQVDCSQVPCVALTFDDGPSAFDAALLDQLAALGVRATFFNTGQNSASRPELVRRQAEAGHALGGHSWNHQDMKRRSPAEACQDARRTADAIKDASGVETILVRPPYGSWNDEILAACEGMTFILWDVDTQDWSSHDVAQITQHGIDDSRPGSIVLMHDTVAETIEALPGIVAGLKAKGYELVTVPELWNEPIAPGQAIYSGPRASG